MLSKKSVLNNFAESTGKQLCRVSSLIELQTGALQPASLLRKGTQRWCFSMDFVKLLRTPLGDCFLMKLFCVEVCFPVDLMDALMYSFSEEHSGRLLLILLM